MSGALRRVRIDLAYDGTAYRGWQIQPNGATVQGVLEASLARLSGGRPVKTRGAGRTDAGVHARGQVADALVADGLDDADLCRALRAMLPPDVRPLRVATVAADFHARRDAVAKTYRYRIDGSIPGNPFLARFALHHPRPLDLDAVDDALARLTGRRDFSGFAAAACEVESRVREMSEARLEAGPGRSIAFVLTADGFLTHMARNIAGTLIEIGRGRFAPGRVDEILASADRGLAGATAPAHALSLERVVFASGPPSGADDPWPIVE